ncbi:MAG: CHASE2 domain-containing protein [Paramuribaculum sp.]|nr:CHASE2 domain-containing protein [Paramuribaculum sp.]
MSKRKIDWKTILIGIARAGFVTFLAFLFSFFFLEPLSFSALSVFSAPEKRDFSITDLYAQVANNRPVHTLDQDIILVDIGHSDRVQIAEIINQVKFWQPKVVGIDILFAKETPDDSVLVSALSEAAITIIPVGLKENPSGYFEIEDKPFFYPDDKYIYAASNMPSNYDGATIREFVTEFPLKDNESILSYPMAIAKAYNPQSLEQLFQRNKKIETIDYASREFITMTKEDIMTDGSVLTDRIVLIGAISDGLDMHSSPVDSYISGLNIHAASIATILNGNYFDPAFSCPAWLPACILCFLVLLVREFSKVQMRGFITRILQFIIVYLAVRIGYSLYVDSHRIFDFSYTLLMVTFGLFAVDIWIGLEFLAKKSKNRVIRYINKCQSILLNNRT